MSALFITLRLIHVLFGVLWVGFGVFVPFMLLPALDDAGPESAGKVMGALQKRGIMTVLPLIALATIVSGAWLYWLVSGGDIGGFMRSSMGQTLAFGATAAIAAYAIGIVVSRPSMLKAGAIMQSLQGVTNAEERDAKMSIVRALRARGALAGRMVAILLIIAAAAMGVARYWPA